MRQLSGQGFNKEKLVFLIASAGFALGLYQFLISGPIPLEPDQPISTQKRPEAPRNQALEDLLKEIFYVGNGKDSEIPDPRTAKLVNRERKSPFQPASEFGPGTKVPLPGPTPAPPPPPPETPKPEPQEAYKAGPPPEALVEFMGTVFKNGESYALLRPKDGSSPIRKKLGEKIDEMGYTITKIEPKSIEVTDDEKRPYILKDTESNATSHSAGGDDMGDDEPKPAPTPKKKEPPKDKPKSDKKDDKKGAKKAATRPERPTPPKRTADSQPNNQPQQPAQPNGNNPFENMKRPRTQRTR